MFRMKTMFNSPHHIKQYIIVPASIGMTLLGVWNFTTDSINLSKKVYEEKIENRYKKPLIVMTRYGPLIECNPNLGIPPDDGVIRTKYMRYSDDVYFQMGSLESFCQADTMAHSEFTKRGFDKIYRIKNEK